MERPNSFGPAGSQLGELGKYLPLLQLLAQAKGTAPSGGEKEGTDPSKLVREIVRASFADDVRGAALREGWKQIGAGALVILRAFSAEETPAGG